MSTQMQEALRKSIRSQIINHQLTSHFISTGSFQLIFPKKHVFVFWLKLKIVRRKKVFKAMMLIFGDKQRMALYFHLIKKNFRNGL